MKKVEELERSQAHTYWEQVVRPYSLLPQPECEGEDPHTEHDWCEPVRYTNWYLDGKLYRVICADPGTKLASRITWEEITRSEPLSNTACFLAIGLSKAPDVVNVKVGDRVVWTMMKEGYILRWHLRKDLYEARTVFDQKSKEAGHPIAAPGTWTVYAPPEHLRYGHKPKQRQGSDKRTGKTKNAEYTPPVRPPVYI